MRVLRKLNGIVVGATLACAWGFWLFRMGVNDHDDMLSNELLFARAHPLHSLLFNIPWPDQSPLYFVYLHVVTAFGTSPFVIQLVNAVLLTATLIATYRLALTFSSSPAVGNVAVFLGAVSPASLWLVRNGRMYSLQLLFSVLACVFVLRIIDAWRPRDLAAFAALCLLNIYTHFVGFLTTAMLFVPLVIDAWARARHDAPGRDGRSGRPAILLGVTALAVGLMALPQIVRLVFLVTHVTPARADVSLPGLTRGFMQRVGWFWFVNADWGTLRAAERTITAVYIGSILVLAFAGIAAVQRRRGLAATLWIVLPLAMAGLAAPRVDIRDRYFAWTLPMLWVAIATGALGPMPSRRLTGARADIARGIRAGLVVAVTATSVWLLWHKLREPYAEWYKLMSAVERIYRPSMVTYMPPGSPIGMPRAVARELSLPAALQDVRDLSTGTRAAFLDETARGRDFVFFVYDIHENAEMQWRVRYLEDRGYRRSVIAVYGATAQVFTRTDIDAWWREQRLATGASPDAIAQWARTELRGQPASGARPAIRNALAARVDSNGVARVGRLFVDQRGEFGSWKLGPKSWDMVEERRASSGKVEREVIAAHPASDSTLVIGFPGLVMKKSLALSYGIADSGLVYRAGAPVEIQLYVNGTRAITLSCPNTAGWKTVVADTSAFQGSAGDVVLLLTTVDDTSRHFAFSMETSSRAAPLSGAATSAGPVVLEHGMRLSQAVADLRVYRMEAGKRIDPQPDGRTYAAADMHEDTQFADSGAVRRVWALGPALWDAVGQTRQRSAGESRQGLWAHPRNGTSLVIEAENVDVGPLLRGFFGFTDFSVRQAQGLDVDAPVTFTIYIDGRAAFTHDTPRAAGWISLAVPVNLPSQTHSLKVEISCRKDSWAHFVFDLWSD